MGSYEVDFWADNGNGGQVIVGLMVRADTPEQAIEQIVATQRVLRVVGVTEYATGGAA